MTLSEKIEQLCCSSFYPHPVEVITTIETHISVVFLTGSYAYKLKKPVNFGFLDFSTLEKRQTYCQLELKLNRRTAPELYIETLAIYENQGQLTLTPTTHPPIDYLVKMHQFDPNLVLGRYLIYHTLSASQIETLAQNIAQLHLTAERATKHSEFGTPTDLIQPMLENFPPLLETFSHPEQNYRLRQLKDWTIFTQKNLTKQLTTRKTQGFIKACHGDMHLDNIALINECPILFDGIEFNEQFRWIDTISDLAFLCIDCDYRAQFILRRQLVNRYFNLTGDYQGYALLKFYQAYRALVRAKITTLRYHQLSASSLEAKKTLNKAQAYITQAENYAYDLSQPQLILMHGISGSGKSYYAHQLLNEIDAIILSSDIERKRLYQIPPNHRVSEQEKGTLYALEMNRKTYQRLLDLSRDLLSNGISVIVDATFLHYDHRQPFSALAAELNLPYKLFSIQPDPAIIERNLTHRAQTNTDPSDATFEVAQKQLKRYQPLHTNEANLTIAPQTELSPSIIESFLQKD